jgi:hypothetical protein
VTVQNRLTATIDHVNASIRAGTLLPCVIAAVRLHCDSRFAEIEIRYEDGGVFYHSIAASHLQPVTMMETVYRSYLVDFLGLDPEPDDAPFETVAFGTGYAPPAAAQATHDGPQVAQ